MLIEKPIPIWNESIMEHEENINSFEMTNDGEDLSILEYGPGIVKKLRSRYQSLALRQHTARPTLRRSASLEDCLDAVSAEHLAATLESKFSNRNENQHQEDGKQSHLRNRYKGGPVSEQQNSGATSPAAAASGYQKPQAAKEYIEQNIENSNSCSSGTTPRGRSSGIDAIARRDRMRRARSVDALHRTKREEEILEKFKHVVLPKEEIVIIEVSKPQEVSVISSAAVFCQIENGSKIGVVTREKRFPTRLLLTSNTLGTSAAVASIFDQQVTNLMISPEHELPPQDIVRETARIFEKNQENLNKKIGNALRVSKAQTGATGSPPMVPPATPIPSTLTSNICLSAPSQQQNTVMAQRAPSSSQAVRALQDKSFPIKMSKQLTSSNAETNGNGTTITPNGQKQIGIIKPTMNNTNNSFAYSKATNDVSSGGVAAESRVRSPILSPIRIRSHSQKPLIVSSLKPPLSPKPIFTSSPKISISVAASNEEKGKTVPTENPSPSTSPVLIIEDGDCSLSLLEKSILKVGGDISRITTPVFSKNCDTPPDSLEGSREVFTRSPSPVNKKFTPFNNEDGPMVVKRLERVTNVITKSRPPFESKEKGVIVLKPVLLTGQQQVNISDHRQQIITKDSTPSPPPRSVLPAVTSLTSVVETTNMAPNKHGLQSQLRVHQNQKSSQGGNGSVVFNFTNRKEIPDYIEDDGIRRPRASEGSNETMQSLQDGLSPLDAVASTTNIPCFEGGNVIINGKSSIQRNPKSQKKNISFNESATTTHEYPSESCLLLGYEPTLENETCSSRKPNVTSGGNLGNYTPKVGSNAFYQLGSYAAVDSSPVQISKSTGGIPNKPYDEEKSFIEDYLKPNTENTTWSNEMSSDILF